MKFYLNALLATLALVTSISAQATLSLPNTGNGSLMLQVIDRTANVSALFDLGLTYSDLNLAASSGPIGASAFQSIRWDIAANTDYSAAWAQLFASGATSANLQYAVIAADNLGTGEGGQGYISTYAGQGSTQLVTVPLVTSVGSFNNYIVNTTFVGSPTLVNSFPTTTTNGALAIRSVDNIFVNGKLNNSGNFIFGAIDSDLGIQQVVSGRASVAPVNQVTYPYPVFTLTSAGQLRYNVLSVPEAETSLMLLAGLGLMSFVSRRKQTK